MSKEKEFQEPVEKYYRSDESKSGSIQEDDSAYRKEIKAAHQSCSNRQYNQKEDPKETIVSTFDPRSMPIGIILQAIMHSGVDKTLRAEDIIKTYGLDKTKADILKTFIFTYANYSFTSESYRPGNVIGALQANGSSSHPSRNYSNNHSNFLAAYQTVNSYADADTDTNGVAASLFSYLHQKAQSGMSYQNFHSSPPLLVATDGSGGNDPECTKLSITSMYYGGPNISASFMRYLVELKSKNSKEIHSEVPAKEDYSLNSLDKQESNVDDEASEEERNCELLASPDFHYGREEVDDVADESSVYSLDSGIQYATIQAGDTDKNENEEGDDSNSNSTGDSSGGEIADNYDGVAMPPEGNPVSLLQAPYLAGEGDTVQMETTQYDGKHQLVGINYTIQTSDYTADQSQLVGSQSYHLIQSEAPATKHYSLIDHGSGIAVTVDGTLENMIVSDLSQDFNCNDEVEQAQELFPLANPIIEAIISPPKSLDNNHLFYPFQPEDPFVSLFNEVDPLTEMDLSTEEDTSSEISYGDAVEASEDSCHHSVSLSMSPAAENVDNLLEEVRIHMPP